MYDFNIIENPHTEDKIKHSFTIDPYGKIYKWNGKKDYMLSPPECRLINNAGGVDKIWHFLKYGMYKDTLTIGNLLIVNLNP